MLRAEQIANYADNSQVLKLYQQAEEDIIVEMAGRIARTGKLTKTANWQLYRLEAIGANRAYIRKRLAKILGRTEKNIAKLLLSSSDTALKAEDSRYIEAGITPTHIEGNPELEQIIAAQTQLTQGVFRNLNNTTSTLGGAQFANELDRAHLQITTGAFTYDRAIQSAIGRIAAKGVTAVTYPSGRKDNIDVAARRTVLTGVNQTALKVSMRRAEQLGVKLVETSAHVGARPEHSIWQGKIFSIK